MKVCSTCRRELPGTDFNRRAASPDGLQAVCRSCNASRARRYYAENIATHRRAVAAQLAKTRAAHLDRIGRYLLDNPCVDCGECDIRVLDFDHREGVEKTAEVMKLAKGAYSWRRVSAEIAKCEVRCRNCHARVTYERMGDNWRSALMARAPADTRTRTGASEAGPPAA
jgi:hypothetical protein